MSYMGVLAFVPLTNLRCGGLKTKGTRTKSSPLCPFPKDVNKSDIKNSDIKGIIEPTTAQALDYKASYPVDNKSHQPQ